MSSQSWVLVFSGMFLLTLSRAFSKDYPKLSTIPVQWRMLIVLVCGAGFSIISTMKTGVSFDTSVSSFLQVSGPAFCEQLFEIIMGGASAASILEQAKSTITILMIGVGISMGLGAASGCSALQSVHQLADQAREYTSDARTEVANLREKVTAALDVLTDVPADVRNEILVDFERCNALLIAVNTALDGAVKITDETSLLVIFGDFIAAYDRVSSIVSPLLSRARTSGRLRSDVVVHVPAIVSLAHQRRS